MVVYVEMALLENLLIDGTILYLVLKTLGRTPKFYKIFLASLFGAGFALFSVGISFSGVIEFLIKVLASFVMCFMTELDFSKIIQKTLIFLFYTFCFGGMLLAVFSFLGVSTVDGFVLGYNSNIPIGMIAACFIIFVIITLKLLKKLYQKRKVEQFCYDVFLTINQKQLKLKGFLDTGNTLTDKNQKPIIIVNQKYLTKWFCGKNMMSFLFDVKSLNLKNCQKVSIKSVSGERKVLVFDAERCVFQGKEKNVVVGFLKEDLFFKNGFDVILNPKMVEV